MPEAFASAPESWSPDQIEQFQDFWDSVMFGDQSRKHQIRWMPGGSTIAWSNEKDFTDAFSLFLMRKTASAYHVVPADIGFTESVNRSSGESQADVQHRVGDLPLIEHVEGILSAFLQDDLGLPLRLEFDRGEEQDDQLNVAQADEIYIQNGVVGASEMREMRFGLTEPEGQMVPRFIYTGRAGPIPLSSLLDVAGPTDTETSAPVPGDPLPHKEFAPVEGVVPVPPPKVPALAERIYGEGAIPPPPPVQGESAPVTPAPVAKAEPRRGSPATRGSPPMTSTTRTMRMSGRIWRKRSWLRSAGSSVPGRRAGAWRDFRFTAVEPETARGLNQAGRAAVAKAGGAAQDPKGPGSPGADPPPPPPPPPDGTAREAAAAAAGAAAATVLAAAEAEALAAIAIAVTSGGHRRGNHQTPRRCSRQSPCPGREGAGDLHQSPPGGHRRRR